MRKNHDEQYRTKGATSAKELKQKKTNRGDDNIQEAAPRGSNKNAK
jgi:hypothetical protein